MPKDGLMERIDAMLTTGDRKAWREFLAAATMQEAFSAHLRASTRRGLDDMRTLAFKRCQHLNGEHRHPELW